MKRFLDPLARMGARATNVAEGGRLPLTLKGARDPIPMCTNRLPLRTAQVRRAAGRPRGAGRDGGDRRGGHARSHRTHAAAFGAEIAVAPHGAPAAALR